MQTPSGASHVWNDFDEDVSKATLFVVCAPEGNFWRKPALKYNNPRGCAILCCTVAVAERNCDRSRNNRAKKAKPTDRSTAQAKAKGLTLEDEKECGRPLGVRWHDGKLYILDAYHGLFELDVKTGGGAMHLVSLFPVPFSRVTLMVSSGDGRGSLYSCSAWVLALALPLCLLKT